MRVDLGSMTPGGVGVPLGVSSNPRDPAQRGVALGLGEGHRLILGPTGSGKFWAAIAPLLLTVDAASVVVFDVATGEAFKHTAQHRAELGPVLKLDPYAVTGEVGGGLNPLDVLTSCKDVDALVGLGRQLTEAVVMTPRTGGESDFWNDSAKDYCTALCLHVATSPDETERTLGRVRDLIVTDPLMRTAGKTEKEDGLGEWVPSDLLLSMLRNRAAHGHVSDYAESVISDFDGGNSKLFGNARRTLQTQTSFLDDRRVRRCLDRTTLPIRALRERVATLYVVAPTKELHNLGRWLRLVYTSLLGDVLDNRDAEDYAAGRSIPLHVVLDEFAAFGPFRRVADDLATVRKYGLHYHIAVQKVSQLVLRYGADGWEQFIPDCLHVLGCDENRGADYLSQMLGTVTRRRKSEGQSRSAGGGSTSTNETETREPLLAPHEILEMPADKSLVVVRPGVKLDLLKWWAHSDPYLLSRASEVARRAA